MSSSGAFYATALLHSGASALWPDGIDWIPVGAQRFASDLPFDGSDIFPIACHSHNDYWRSRPLFKALENGCSAIEADVWLSTDGEVFAGHTPASLSADRTFSTMYIDPILEILDHANPQAMEVGRYESESQRNTRLMNGVFENAPKTTLILLIDFKKTEHGLWPAVYSQLDSLRRKGYLTYFNGTFVTKGPVTVVVSGDAAFDNVVGNAHYRDMFFDAPLELMSSLTIYQQDVGLTAEETIVSPPDKSSTTRSTARTPPIGPTAYNTTNSFYASVSFKSSIGYPVRSKLTRAQMALMRSQIRGAHAQGLKVRYWGVPSWPVGVRNYLWRVLVREGVDYLSVDDVRALAKDNWGPRKGGWGRKWWF